MSGMPLKSLNLSRCSLVTDAGLANLRGAPLSELSLSHCSLVTDTGLANLTEAPLEKLDLERCWHVSEGFLRSLIAGKHVTNLNLIDCGRVTGGILPNLRGLPLVEFKCSGYSGGGFLFEGVQGLAAAVPSIEKVFWVFDPPRASPAYRRGWVLYGQASDETEPVLNTVFC